MKPTTMMILMTTILAACHTQAAPTQAAPTQGALTARPQSAELAARRAQLIGWLHEYYEAGQYPTDETGQPQSVFVDAKGVRCPMAELIWRSGHHDLVDAVAREHNAVRLAEVTEGPLHDWMVGSGLTPDEISLVQGAMDLDMTWMNRETGEVILANGTRFNIEPKTAIQPNAAIIARAEIRGRLETAEKVLTDGTARSLDAATKNLPNGKLPIVTVTGKVIPKQALRSGPQFPHAPVATLIPHAPVSTRITAQTLEAVRTKAALRRTSETSR